MLNSANDWRLVAGYGLVYALLGGIAVAVGSLVRQPAGTAFALLGVATVVLQRRDA